MSIYFDTIQPLLLQKEFNLYKNELEENLKYLLMATESPFSLDCSWPIQQITEDKSKQIPYVDVRTWKKGDSNISSTGYWIIKKRDGSQGEGISIFSNQELEEFLQEFTEDESLDDVVAQEYHKTVKTDLLPVDVIQSVLRLHLEFTIDQYGNIDIKEHYGYAVGYMKNSGYRKSWKDVDFCYNKIVATASQKEIDSLIRLSIEKIRKIAKDAGEIK
jgi:hypothetical protein